MFDVARLSMEVSKLCRRPVIPPIWHTCDLQWKKQVDDKGEAEDIAAASAKLFDTQLRGNPTYVKFYALRVLENEKQAQAQEESAGTIASI